jgi:hypothetical protein
VSLNKSDKIPDAIIVSGRNPKPALPPYSDLPRQAHNKTASAVSILNTDRIEPTAAHRA